MMYIGIDIGGTKCAVTRAPHPLRTEKKIKFETADFASTFARICEAVEACLPADAIGISCGGPLDEEKGLILSPPNLPGWDEIAIVDALEARFGLPTFLRNDANACALAEWRHGAGEGTRNMIFLTFGTGLGAGLILDGKLYSGSNGMAGEVGHIRLAKDGPIGYGKEGSFEGFCSGGGIAALAVRYAEKAFAEGKETVFGCKKDEISRITAKLVGDLAEAGDGDAIAVYRESAKRLGEGLSILIDAFNPDAIVIGSIFARSRALFEDTAMEIIRKEALANSVSAFRLLPAALGESIGDIAALTVAEDGLMHKNANRKLAFSLNNIYNAPQKEIAYKHVQTLISRYPALEKCKEDIISAIDRILASVQGGGKILLCGNGGSASDAEHISGEFLKGFLLHRTPRGDTLQALAEAIGEEDAKKLQGGIPALPLPSFSAVLSAFANDVDARLVYAQETYALGRAGDILIAMSTSGNSENVVLAAKTARAMGLTTVALTGKDGGKLAAIADIPIIVPANETYQIQAYHLPVYHAICAEVEEILFG